MIDVASDGVIGPAHPPARVRAAPPHRAGRARALLGLMLLGLAACPRPRTDDPNRVDGDDAVVFVTSAVPDAALWVDGVLVGPVSDLRRGFAVEPGRHRLELHHDAYFSHYQELDLAPAQRLRLSIELAPTLP